MSDAEVTPGMSSQAIADLAISRLHASPDPAPDATETDAPDPPATETGDDAAETPSVENAPQPDPEPAPSVEPPASWTPAEKEAFKALPPAHQQVIADRERDRSRNYQKGLEEAAAARKEREAIAAERTRTADQLNAVVQQALLIDPILAAGPPKPELARTDPAAYVDAKAQYDQRLAFVNHVAAERDRLATEGLTQAKRQMVETLRADESLGLRDQAKWDAFNTNVSQYLVAQGVPAQRIAAVTDPTLIKLAHKAMLYDQGVSAKKAIEAKRQAPAPKRTLAPGAADDGPRANPRLEAAERAALRSGNPRRMAEVAMARLRANPNPS